MGSHNKTDQSIIIEILEHVTEPDLQALHTHYSELAGSNAALGPGKSDILSTEQIPHEQLSCSQCGSAYFLAARQMVSKFKESAENTLHIHLALLSLPQYDTDILITFNDPVNISV